MTNQPAMEGTQASYGKGTVYTVLDMPPMKSKYAPKKFKGSYREVEKFLAHYERLCQKFNVTTDKEKCETITQYCSLQVADVIEGLACYQLPNWSDLKQQLLKLYCANMSYNTKHSRSNFEAQQRAWKAITQELTGSEYIVKL